MNYRQEINTYKEINNLLNEFSITYLPVIMKAILIMLPSLLYSVYVMLMYNPMSLDSLSHLLYARCGALFSLIFSCTIILPFVISRKYIVLIGGITLFSTTSIYFVGMPYKNQQFYDNIGLIQHIKFNINKENQVITNAYFANICQDLMCEMKVLSVAPLAITGNLVRFKVTLNNGGVFYTDSIDSTNIKIDKDTLIIQ